MSDHFYSGLYKAKNLGSSSGFSHWWMQRITSIILIPVSLWLIVQYKIIGDFKEVLLIPSNFASCIMFILCSFYHARLGMQVIIEDYISLWKLRITLLVLLDIFVFITVTATIVALFISK